MEIIATLISSGHLVDSIATLSVSRIVCEPISVRPLRPSVKDAARVLDIEEDEVIRILVSSGCLSRKVMEWMIDRSSLPLDGRAVACLMKYNRKKLKRYYRSASRAAMSMSGEEKRTFDNFVRLYVRTSKSGKTPRIDNELIDQVFLRELFSSQGSDIRSSMEPSESSVLWSTRRSLYYRVRINETSAYDSMSGILPEWFMSMIALRYHIFTTEDDIERYSISLGYFNS